MSANVRGTELGRSMQGQLAGKAVVCLRVTAKTEATPARVGSDFAVGWLPAEAVLMRQVSEEGRVIAAPGSAALPVFRKDPIANPELAIMPTGSARSVGAGRLA